MLKINYVCADQGVRTIQAAVGSSVMEVAVREAVPGMVGECGGAGSCATCHVYVDDAFLQLVGEADGLEAEMLDDAASIRRHSSRLACQICLTAEMDGLTVEVAPAQ